MKENTLFFQRFIKNSGKIGAIAPSSKFLVKQVIDMISFEKTKVLVELGAGTGILSSAILRQKKKETNVIMLEPDEEFFGMLKKKFPHEEKVQVVQESAQNLPGVLAKLDFKKVDCVVSSLPFMTLGHKVSETILSTIAEILASGGHFVFYQYTPFRIFLVMKYFRIERFAFTALNAPPAFVFLCSSRLSQTRK